MISVDEAGSRLTSVMAKGTRKKTGKSKPRKRPPARVENPAWLSSDPVGEGPPPPVTTRSSALPFLELGWENFERLCYRLAQAAGEVEKAWSYGTSGYGQQGIDVLVRMKDGSFEAWQSKRHKAFGLAALKEAVNVFARAKWAKQAKRFTLAVACTVNDPRVIDEIEKIRTRLEKRDIEFQPLFATELTEKLRPQPAIIDDFFGRDWVGKVCAPEIIAALSDRVSSVDMAELRTRLRTFYTAWVGTVDPGLPLVGQGSGEIPAPELSRRYVVPDVILELGVAEHERISEQEGKRTAEEPRSDPTADETGADVPRPRNMPPPQLSERRIPVGQFLAETARAVILGDAGAGKSTLLRYLALEILSEQPSLVAIGQRYAGYLPVWVPFALWARMSEGKDRPPPLEDVVHGFIQALNEQELAEKMRRVLRTGKFVLLVDGLDEIHEQPIADALLVSLTVFAEQAGVSVFATTRPHGVRALSGIGGIWARTRLAPLSESQRGELALLWYRILERHELGSAAAAQTVERQARNRAASFTKALLASSGIARLAQIPLFLLSLLKLHRLGRDLPRNRFDASKEIIEQLAEHQPRRRAKDAMGFRPTQNSRERQRLLADFAFGLHSGELRGDVADGALEADAVTRAASVTMARRATLDRDAAEEQARAVFSFTEEVAGLLVKKAQNNIGFLHRSLQEYFAGAYLAQLSPSDRVAFIKSHATEAVWKEPILYLLYLIMNEQEVGVLVDAIGDAPVSSAADQAQRDALLTEAAFADFAHDLPKARQLVGRFFEEAELYAWGTRQRALFAATVDGLFSQSVSAQCAGKLAEWIDYHGWGRHRAILAMKAWDNALRPACVPLLIRVVAGDHEHAWRAAGPVLAEFAPGDADVKQALLRLVHEPRSIDTLRGGLFALGQGWGKDSDVGALTGELRHRPVPKIQIDAIRIRISCGEADLSDLGILAEFRDRFLYEALAPDLVAYFASRHKPELLKHLERMLEGRERRFEIPLLGSLLIAEPSHRLVQPELRELLSEEWAFSELFGPSQIGPSRLPLERVNWTPELVRVVEDNLSKEKYSDYHWYWVSKILKLPSLKERMIASMKAGEGHFWSSRGLREVWGKGDVEVSEAFRAMLDAPPKDFAEVADDAAAVIDDRAAVREAILRSLREKPRDARFLIAGLRRLGIGSEDDEAFKASYEAGDPKGRSLFEDGWRKSLFLTFASRPQIRELAQAELTMRDGDLGAVAEAYATDPEVCRRIMKVIAPLPDAARLSLLPELGAAAPSNPMALTLLAAARHDTHGATAGEAVMAWSDAIVSLGAHRTEDRQFLADELEALGSEFQQRRAAAVVGLTITGNLSVFANLKDHRGEPQDIDIGRMNALDQSDRYLRRILPYWDQVAQTLGGEGPALKRLGLSPEDTLAILNPGMPAAENLYQLLEAASTQRVPLHERLGAMQRFAPDSAAMRKLIEPLLLRPGSTEGIPQSNSERWPAMMAAEIFADHFAQSDLRQAVIDLFTSNPASDCAAAALAETVLRERDPALGTLLRERAQAISYELVTSLRVTAAIGNPVSVLEWLLRNDPTEALGRNCSYWVPAFLRRIERDDRVADEIIAAVDRAPSASARLSELALLGLGCKDKAKIRPILDRTLRDYEATTAPIIAFDVTAGAYRLAAHTVRELLV
jgi:hypothetical protein